MPNPKRVKRASLEVVENQLRANDPPETRQTLQRLLALGYSRREAVDMIGSAVAAEIWHILHEKEAYDPVRYQARRVKITHLEGNGTILRGSSYE